MSNPMTIYLFPSVTTPRTDCTILSRDIIFEVPDARTQSDCRRLGSVTLARSRVRVRAWYEFVSCRRHGDQRLRGPVTGPIDTSYYRGILSATSGLPFVELRAGSSLGSLV